MIGETIFCHWIWDKPLILRYAEGGVNRPDIGDWLPPDRVYRLPFHCWHRTADQIERKYKRAKANRPAHAIQYAHTARFGGFGHRYCSARAVWYHWRCSGETGRRSVNRLASIH